MTDVKYIEIVEAEFRKLGKWLQLKEEAELNIAKSKQFIFAALNMVPDKERKEFEDKLDALASEDISSGLTDSIKNVLLSSFPNRLTATMVRDKLVRAGFDFSQYSTNPLASVSTVLRRLKAEEVTSDTTEGVTTYRLRSSYAKEMRKRRRERTVGVDALLRTANQYGSTIASLIPDAADRAMLGTPREKVVQKPDPHSGAFTKIINKGLAARDKKD